MLRLALVGMLVVAGLFGAGAARAGEGADAVGYGAGRVVPAVRWAAPAGGEVVAGVLRGSRCAVGVARGRARQVAFFVDGRRRMVDRRVPYRCRIDTRKLRDGRHRFRAVALDRRGKRRAAAVVVRVRNSGSRVRPRDKGGSPGAVVFSGDFDSGSRQWASRQCLAGRLTLGSAAPTPFEGGYRARFEVRAGDVEPLTGNNRCELTNQAEPSVFQDTTATVTWGLPSPASRLCPSIMRNPGMWLRTPCSAARLTCRLATSSSAAQASFPTH